MAMTGLQPSWPFLYANCILVFQTLAGHSDAVRRRDLNQLTGNRIPPHMGVQVRRSNQAYSQLLFRMGPGEALLLKRICKLLFLPQGIHGKQLCGAERGCYAEADTQQRSGGQRG